MDLWAQNFFLCHISLVVLYYHEPLFLTRGEKIIFNSQFSMNFQLLNSSFKVDYPWAGEYNDLNNENLEIKELEL